MTNRHQCAVFIATLLLTFTTGVTANPVGEQVVSGQAGFERNGSNLIITQGTQRVIINWQDFSNANGELTKFIQPNSSSAALNRVVSGNLSSLLGDLQANGKIYLINPNGIVIGADANINTQSFIASTLDVSNAEFMNGGDMNFVGDSQKTIENLGTINGGNGDVFLIAKHVDNSGTIKAEGHVGLAGGNDVLLKASGDDRLSVRVTDKDGRVDQKGLIEAAKIELRTAGNNPYALAINHEGISRATSAVNKEGRIILFAEGGTTKIDGTLDASAPVDGDGGFIETSGTHVEIAESIKIDTSSKNGETGTWLIDPEDIEINSTQTIAGASVIAATTIETNLNTTNVDITSNNALGGNGGITVNEGINSASTNNLTMNAGTGGNINVNQSITVGGDLTLNAGNGANGVNGTNANSGDGITGVAATNGTDGQDGGIIQVNASLTSSTGDISLRGGFGGLGGQGGAGVANGTLNPFAIARGADGGQGGQGGFVSIDADINAAGTVSIVAGSGNAGGSGGLGQLAFDSSSPAIELGAGNAGDGGDGGSGGGISINTQINAADLQIYSAIGGLGGNGGIISGTDGAVLGFGGTGGNGGNGGNMLLNTPQLTAINGQINAAGGNSGGAGGSTNFIGSSANGGDGGNGGVAGSIILAQALTLNGSGDFSFNTVAGGAGGTGALGKGGGSNGIVGVAGANGDMQLNAITTNGNLIFNSGGNITGAGQLTANDITLNANSFNAAIGSAAQIINTNASGIVTASANNGNGGIFLQNQGSLVLDNFSTDTGDLALTATNGTLTSSTSAYNFAGTNLTLTTSEDGSNNTVGDRNIQIGSGGISATTSNITLDSADDIITDGIIDAASFTAKTRKGRSNERGGNIAINQALTTYVGSIDLTAGKGGNGSGTFAVSFNSGDSGNNGGDGGSISIDGVLSSATDILMLAGQGGIGRGGDSGTGNGADNNNSGGTGGNSGGTGGNGGTGGAVTINAILSAQQALEVTAGAGGNGGSGGESVFGDGGDGGNSGGDGGNSGGTGGNGGAGGAVTINAALSAQQALKVTAGAGGRGGGGGSASGNGGFGNSGLGGNSGGTGGNGGAGGAVTINANLSAQQALEVTAGAGGQGQGGGLASGNGGNGGNSGGTGGIGGAGGAVTINAALSAQQALEVTSGAGGNGGFGGNGRVLGNTGGTGGAGGLGGSISINAALSAQQALEVTAGAGGQGGGGGNDDGLGLSDGTGGAGGLGGSISINAALSAVQNLSLIVGAGGQGGNGGSGGGINGSAGQIQGSQIDATSSAGSITVTGVINPDAGGSVSLLAGTAAGQLLTFTTPQDFNLTGTGSLSLRGFGFGSANSFSTVDGDITINSGDGDLVLGAGFSASSSGAGNIVLAAGGDFHNDSGSATPFSLGTGRYVVYSTRPDNNRDDIGTDTNAIAHDFVQYDRTFDANNVIPTALPAGNGFVYSVQPVLTGVSVTVNNQIINYGDTISSILNTDFTVGGGAPATYEVSGVAITATDFELTDPGSVTINSADVELKLDASVGISNAGFAAAGSYTDGIEAGVIAGSALASQGIALSGSGDLTVNTIDLNVTVAADNKVYDATDVAVLSLGADDRLAGDILTIDAGTSTFDDKNVGMGRTVTVAGASLSGADAGNYNFIITNAGTLSADITAADLLVNGAVAQNKVYDQTAAAAVTGASVTALGSDVLVLGAANGLFDDKNAGTGKTVTTSFGLTGTDAGNYNLIQPTTLTADVTARTLNATLAANDKVYDATTLATGNFGDDRIAGDVLAITGTSNFDTKDVGTNKTVTATGLGLSGTDASNYVLASTSVNDLADIAQAALIAIANDDTKVFDGIPYSGGNGVSYAGFVGGEDASVLAGTLNYSGSSQGATNPGGYAITPGGLTSGNYAVTFVDGGLTINAATSGGGSGGNGNSSGPNGTFNSFLSLVNDGINSLNTDGNNFVFLNATTLANALFALRVEIGDDASYVPPLAFLSWAASRGFLEEDDE
jgi:trimeric autotransporter adhesin